MDSTSTNPDYSPEGMKTDRYEESTKPDDRDEWKPDSHEEWTKPESHEEWTNRAREQESRNVDDVQQQRSEHQVSLPGFHETDPETTQQAKDQSYNSAAFYNDTSSSNADAYSAEEIRKLKTDSGSNTASESAVGDSRDEDTKMDDETDFDKVYEEKSQSRGGFEDGSGASRERVEASDLREDKPEDDDDSSWHANRRDAGR